MSLWLDNQLSGINSACIIAKLGLLLNPIHTLINTKADMMFTVMAYLTQEGFRSQQGDFFLYPGNIWEPMDACKEGKTKKTKTTAYTEKWWAVILIIHNL